MFLSRCIIICCFFYTGTDLHASPKSEFKKPKEVKGTDPIDGEESKPSKELELINITEPPHRNFGQIEEDEPTIYNYNQSLSIKGGGFIDKSSATNIRYFLGIAYMAESLSSNHWEAAIDVTSDSIGHFQFTRKWIYLEEEPFRYNFRGGINLKLEGDQGLGNFVDVDNYFLFLAAGIEFSVLNTTSVRVDLEGAGNTVDYMGRLSVGYVFGF